MIKTIYIDNFFNNSKFLQLHKGFFLWTGTPEFTRTVLRDLGFYKSTSDMIDSIYLSHISFFLENKKAAIFLREVKRHDYSDLATSVIFSYLQTTYKKDKVIKFTDWDIIFPAVLNPVTTNSVFLFLEEFNMFHFLLETKTESEFITGLLLYYQIKADFTLRSPDLREIRNLLNFLKVDQPLIGHLIETIETDKNFKNLTKFLQEYKFDL